MPCHNKGMNNYSCKPNKPIKEMCAPEIGISIVVIPAQSGDSEGIFAPKIGDYKNTLVKYLADSKVFMYDKDGNYTFVGASNIEGVTVDSELSLGSTNPVQNRVVTKAINDTEDLIDSVQDNVDAEADTREHDDGVLSGRIDDEVLARQGADATLQDNIDAEALARGNADSTLQGNIDAEVLARANAVSGVNTKLNRAMVNDLVMTSDANNVAFVEQKINLDSGATSSESDVIPAASATTAGTITAADYLSIKSSQRLLEAIDGGSVAIPNITASPSQQDLTNAWEQATGQSTLINRASIYDIDNNRIWTYYVNSGTWYSVSAGGANINPFTNSVAGTILGSSTDGNVSANNDGTGTVAGWSTLVSTVAGKADSSSLAAVATSGAYSDLTGTPTLAAVATSGAYSDLSGTPTVPSITMTDTDPGEGQPLAADSFIAVYSNS